MLVGQEEEVELVVVVLVVPLTPLAPPLTWLDSIEACKIQTVMQHFATDTVVDNQFKNQQICSITIRLIYGKLIAEQKNIRYKTYLGTKRTPKVVIYTNVTNVSKCSRHLTTPQCCVSFNTGSNL